MTRKINSKRYLILNQTMLYCLHRILILVNKKILNIVSVLLNI